MSKKSVRVTGYHQNNLGDDLFFYILFRRYPNVDFYCNVPPQFYNQVFCEDNAHVDKYTKLFAKFTGAFGSSKLNYIVNRFLRHFYFKLRKEAKESYDADVTVVGSWFIEHSDMPALNLNSVQIQDKSYDLIKNEYPKLILGTNIGPVSTQDYLEKTKLDLQDFDDVCFRDKASYNLYSFMSNVRYAPDIVLNLDIDKFSCIKQEKEILFNIIDIDWKISDNQLSINYNSQEYYKKIAEIANGYIRDGYKINLVSFCDNEGDKKAIKKVCSNIESKEMVNTYYYNGNIDEILSVFARSSYIISGRFHAMIISMLLKKPFTPIIYNDKMNNYLADVNFCGISVDIKDISAFNYKTFNQNYERNYILDISAQIKDADKQFEVLDKLLD